MHTSVVSPSPSPVSAPNTPRSPSFPKKKFRTVLGFGSLDSRPRSPAVLSDPDDDNDHPVLITTSNSPSTTARRKPSVTDTTTFFATPDQLATTIPIPNSPPASSRSSMDVEEMNIDLAAVPPPPAQQAKPSSPSLPARSSSKPNFRLTPQWGPWTVSVAETPTDASNYNVYVKTPTHNYTLTRSQKEIIELHTKLRDSFPTAVLPNFPLTNVTPNTTPPAGGKRRSSFLHTLSRLANNNSSSNGGKSGGKAGSPRPNTANGVVSPTTSSIYPTPLTSPSAELTADPFALEGSVTSQLAAYLTSVANDQKCRGARPWKRFMRVRTDDLESVRVERAIKRVRSDVAMHTSPSAGGPGHVNGFGNTTSPSIQSRLDVGMSLGADFGAGSLGLSPEGGFQSEVEGDLESASEPPSKTTSDVDVPGHAKEDTVKADSPTTTTVTDKRVSSVMAMPSAFSSDSALPDTTTNLTTTTGSLGSAPPTPTPALAKLAPPSEHPEDVALPPSPAMGQAEAEEDNATTQGLPTPINSPQGTAKIPRSKSADPEKAARRFKNLQREASDSVDGDMSVAEVTDADIDAPSSTTDADADPTTKKSRGVKKAHRKPAKKVTVDDFDMMRVLGKGCAGKVLLVKYKKTGDLYALKAITKRHVLAHQELQHTLTEQAVLKRMSRESKDPFVVKLWWSFHDKDNLFLVMDFHPGGDLATQLARWGRLGRDRARFYAAEIVEGVDGLHAAGVIYRDLKPENILIGADGHIVLTDFGLSKEFPRRMNGTLIAPTASGTPTGANSFGGDYYSSAPITPGAQQQLPYWMNGEDAAVGGGVRDVTSTFCGTAEYLAPEVIQGLPYSYEVDWWSFGTMLYEMLSGITPFWANNHSDMYVRVLQDELQFPDDRAMDQDTKSLIRGLLQRNPALRMSEPRIKRHPYFSMIDWDHVYYKRYIPPYIPPIDPSNASDTQNFDETFLEMQPTIENEDHMVSDSEREKEDEGAKTDGEEADANVDAPADAPAAAAAPSVDSSVDVFDGYSFKGRHSVLIDDEDYEGYADEEGDDDEILEAKKVTDALAAMHANVEPTVKSADDISETGTIEQSTNANANKEKDDQQAAVSIVSTPPESAVTASISSEAESVVAPRTHKEIKQASESSTVPTLTTGSTALTTPSGEFAESPVTGPDSPLAIKTFDDAANAPLPLSPVIEAGNVEEESLASPILPQPPKPEVKPVPTTPVQQRTRGARKEKSGVKALDRGEEDATEREEDDWDLVETPRGEDRNGTKAPSLWQRGVVDRYRLAVFRKSGSSNQGARRSANNSSVAFETSDSPTAPSPSSPLDNKHRRGRTGISLRKSTRDFLRAKSPSAAFSAHSSAASRASLAQQPIPPMPNVSSVGLLTPSPSGPATKSSSSRPVPSLKSKSSALSKASYGSPPSSDQSVTDLRNHNNQQQHQVVSTTDVGSPARSPMTPRAETARASPRGMDDAEKTSNLKKMKKYTEQSAEKMLSLFSSPRHHQQQQQQQ